MEALECLRVLELEIVIRDIFAVGMGPGKMHDNLLEEDASDKAVTLTKLMEIAINEETKIVSNW